MCNKREGITHISLCKLVCRLEDIYLCKWVRNSREGITHISLCKLVCKTRGSIVQNVSLRNDEKED